MAYRRTPLVQARLDAQRAALLDAAARLLAEQGFRGCSVASVATGAGMAAGSVYNHFAGKSELVAEVFRAAVGTELAAVAEAVGARTGAAEQLRAVIETFAARASRCPRRAYALLAEPVDPAVERLRLQFRQAFADLVEAALEDGVATGSLPAQDTRVVASAVVGAIAESLVAPLAALDTSSPTEVDDGLVETLVTMTHRAIGAGTVVPA